MAGYTFTGNGIPEAALEQTETWYSKNGTEHAIRDMAKPYARACLKFIIKWHGLHARSKPLYRALEEQARRGPLWVQIEEQQAADNPDLTLSL